MKTLKYVSTKQNKLCHHTAELWPNIFKIYMYRLRSQVKYAGVLGAVATAHRLYHLGPIKT